MTIVQALLIVSASAGRLSWESVSVKVEDKQIVSSATVHAHPGRLLGVLGPSGAGKTTLLGVLSGRCTAHPHKQLTGHAHGAPGAHEVSVLEQSENFFGLLSVRETLELAMELEGSSGPEAGAEVDALLQTLGLIGVQHSRVGDATHRGISGGEKRRLAVALALSAHPALLVADEPTTSLDSHQAMRVVRLVREAASARAIPAVATLHQPRSSIWAHLDDVLILAPHGRVVYHGPRAKALAYFAKRCHPCPSHTNPAEHIIDLVSIDFDSPVSARDDERRIAALARAWSERNGREQPPGRETHPSVADAADAAATAATAAATTSAASPARRRPRPLRRLLLLLRRSWRQNIRDGWVNGLRLGVSGGLALVFGEIFGRFGKPTAAQLAERIALLSYASINMAMMALMKTLDLLGREKLVVERERARGQYGSAEYVIAKMLTELPLDAAFAAGFGALLHWRIGLRLPPLTLIATLSLTAATCAGLGLTIGALAPSADAALAMGIPIMIVHMVLGIINPAGTADTKPPSAGVRLVAHASPIKWAIRALVCAELRGLELDERSLRDAPRMGGLALVKSGDEVLSRLGLGETTSAACCVRLARVLAAELALAYAALRLARPRFASLAPTSNDTAVDA